MGAAVAILTAVPAALADTVLVPQVELREEAQRRYVLRAVLSPRIAGRIRPPVLPRTCTPVGDPIISRDAGVLSWHSEFTCSERLRERDQLYLPWQVDGIRLTAHWLDGTSPERLFGREGAGIVVAIDALIERSTSPAVLARRHLPEGLLHFLTSWIHILAVLAFVATLKRPQLVTVLAGFSSGHAVSLVAAELGATAVPMVPAEATIAMAVVVLLARRSHWRRHAGELALVGVFLGTLHGLGLATALGLQGVTGGALVYGLFFTIVGFESVQWAMGLVAAAIVRALNAHSLGRQTATVHGFGVLAAFTVFASMQIGIGSATVPIDDAGVLDVGGTGGAAANQAAGLTVPLRSQTGASGALAFPFMSYIMVEPYRVRHEILVSVPSLRQWIPVPDVEGIVAVAAQDSIAAGVLSLLRDQTVVRVDAEVVQPVETRADWVAVEPTGILTRQQPIPEPVGTAVIGVILEYATDGLADEVSIEWQMPLSEGSAVPVLLTDPVSQFEGAFAAASPTIAWQNTLGDYELPTIEAIETSKPRVPLPSALLALFGVGVALRTRKATPRQSKMLATAFIGAFALYPFARISAEVPFVVESRLSEDEAAPVLEAMLMNVYRSFDIHDEAAIYDRLALTVTGDQLLDVYLESRRALELENRGGATVRIDEVVVRTVRDVSRAPDGGIVLDAIWTVGGSVNHFGHEHFRQNRYDASVTVVPVEGYWRIAGIELLEERRVL